MLYNNLNLEVAKIASKSETRPEISGVLFRKDRTVATDSFRLLEIGTSAEIKPEDFPVVDGAKAMRGCKPFIVPARGLKDIKVPKNKNLPIVNNVAIKYVDDKRVEFLTTDLETAHITTARKVEGQFPEYEGIFPTGQSMVEVIINGDYLAELLTIIGKLGGAQKQVKIKVYGPEKPVMLEAGDNNQKGRAMLMPIRE
jgi:DNA polymerase III sliding clamp (beta) subunit (PCNA family)